MGVEANQPGCVKCLKGLLKLIPRDATVNFWVLSFADTAGRMVLSHHIDVAVNAQFAGDPPHDVGCSCHTSGHDEVTQKNAAQSQAMFISDQRAHLSVHP